MKLSICIPTHHGRCEVLQELLESIFNEVTQQQLESLVRICISDNASSDGTEELVARFTNAYPGMINYQRLVTNTGIRNFFTVIAMSETEYCWLIGSDDAIIPSGVKNVLQFLASHPDISGITTDKLNFDGSLSNLIGPDHDQVLPPSPNESRCIVGTKEILDSLFIPFCFISSHVFRKTLWDDVIARYSVEKILQFRHFPHTFIFSEIASNTNVWGWLAEYCVVQRLDNFSFMTEVSSRELDYAEQFTTDLENIALAVFGEKTDSYYKAMTKLYFLYWNPCIVLKYVSHRETSRNDVADAEKKCKVWFRHCGFFWITTFPILIFPRRFSRILMLAAMKFYAAVTGNARLTPARNIARKILHLALRLLGIERKHYEQNNLSTAAHSFLQMRADTRTANIKP